MNAPANDASRLNFRDALAMSLALPEPEVLKATLDRLPCSIAWDEAASCLARGDTAGFDAAMRIFRKFSPSSRGSVPANNRPESDR